MGNFADTMAARLPPGLNLPREIAALFDWIEARGLLHDSQRVPGDRFGTLQPLAEPYRGAVVLFRVETQSEAAEFTKAWFGDAGLGTRLVPFAKTSGDGGYAAFWRDDEGRQHIVHLGSEGDGLCVLGNTPLDFLRLLAIGYNELCAGLAAPHEPPRDAPQYGQLVDNPPYRDWLTQTYRVGIPETAHEIVGTPPDSLASAHDDPFWHWVRKHQG